MRQISIVSKESTIPKKWYFRIILNKDYAFINAMHRLILPDLNV